MARRISKSQLSAAEVRRASGAATRPEAAAAAMSPPWSAHARLVAALLMVTMAIGVLVLVRQLLVPLILAFLFAYLLHPLITRLAAWWRSPRWVPVLLLYVLLLLLFAGATTSAGLALTQQLVGLVSDMAALSSQLPAFLQELSQTTLVVGPWIIDLSQVNLAPIVEPLAAILRPLVSQTGAILASIAGATASVVGLILAVMLFGYYLLLDFGVMDEYLLDHVPAVYRADFARLMESTRKVWQAFVRGQLILGLVVGVTVAISLAAIGLRFALVLGIIAGILELVPTFGPVIAGILAVLVALFQGSNYLGLTPLGFALVVAGVSILIQQLENNFLVPRILGGSLNLHPLVILIAAIVGAGLAGVLGVLLAAPVVATLRLWVGYMYRKVVGLETWPPDPPPRRARPPGQSWIRRVANAVRNGLARR